MHGPEAPRPEPEKRLPDEAGRVPGEMRHEARPGAFPMAEAGKPTQRPETGCFGAENFRRFRFARLFFRAAASGAFRERSREPGIRENRASGGAGPDREFRGRSAFPRQSGKLRDSRLKQRCSGPGIVSRRRKSRQFGRSARSSGRNAPFSPLSPLSLFLPP